MNKLPVALIILLSMALYGCGGGDSPNSSNQAPNAKISTSSKNVLTSQSIILDGNSSSDPNGDKLTYKWEITSKPSNSNSIINNDSSAQANLVADLAGAYVVSLTVSDGTLKSDPSILTINANYPLTISSTRLTSTLGGIVATVGSATSVLFESSDGAASNWSSIVQSPDKTTQILTKIDAGFDGIQSVDSSTGNYIIATSPVKERNEFKSYDSAGNFKRGFIIFLENQKIYIGRLSTENFISLSALTDIVDITDKYATAQQEYQDRATIKSALEANRKTSLADNLFRLFPAGISYAQATTDPFSGDFETVRNAWLQNLLTRIGKGVYLPLALSVGAAASCTLIPVSFGITTGECIGLSAAAITAYVVLYSSSAQASPIPTTPSSAELLQLTNARDVISVIHGRSRGSYDITFKYTGSSGGTTADPCPPPSNDGFSGNNSLIPASGMPGVYYASVYYTGVQQATSIPGGSQSSTSPPSPGSSTTSLGFTFGTSSIVGTAVSTFKNCTRFYDLSGPIRWTY